MPLIALDPSGGQRIDVRDYDNVRMQLDCRLLVCPFPDCGRPMIPVQGPHVSAHFRHKSTCATEYRASYNPSNETAQHRAGKRFIAQDVAAWFKSRGVDVIVDFEVAIPEIKRIADVLITTPTGERIAVECQLAAISTEELDARTNDYANAGITALWYLGGRAAETNASNWCVYRYGGVTTLQFDEVPA